MTLDYELKRHELRLDRPFAIARGTTTDAEVAVLRLVDGPHEGIGAAAPSARYGETIGTVLDLLPTLLESIGSLEDPDLLQGAEAAMLDRIRGAPAARAAVSIALHDLVATRAGEPLYRRWGLDPADSIPTSFTLGMASPAAAADRAQEAVDTGYGTLKVKLGADRGAEVVAAVREAAPDATIRVDANEAWSPRRALDEIEAMVEHDVQFVEQPVPAENPGGLAFVRDRSSLPIAADESCLVSTDVPAIADAVDVIVVKLMKTGGIREAVRTVHAAHANGLSVMLGCMVESNASLAAAAHLVPLVEYADLDGSLLLADDPYAGVPFDGDRIALADVDRAGTGVHRR